MYWRDDRLYPLTNTRPSGLGPWPKITRFLNSELVAIVEGDVGQIEINEGPAATRERVDKAFLLHRGIEPDSISSQVWSRVPIELLNEIDFRVRSAERSVTNQWSQFSNEEATTGAFFSRLNDSFKSEGWRVNISFVEFSKHTKEPQTGTDIAVVLDALTENGQRSFKTMWFQAKSSLTVPTDPFSLPRMADQIPLAQKYCEASYGLIYTPHGIFVADANNAKLQSFHDTLTLCMQCHLGDTSVTVLKNSLNRKKLLQIVLTEGTQSPEKRMNLRRR